MSEISDFLKDSLDIEIDPLSKIIKAGQKLDEADVPREDWTVGYWESASFINTREMFDKMAKELDDAKRSWCFKHNDILYDCHLRLDCDIHWKEVYPDGTELEYFDHPEDFERKFGRSDMSGLTCIPVSIRALLPQSYFDRKAHYKYVAKTYSEFADVPANFGPGIVPEMPEVTVGAINHCKKADGCSVCSKAGEPSNMQRQCKYWDKATFADRCMHLRFDEFCDCVEAQKDA